MSKQEYIPDEPQFLLAPCQECGVYSMVETSTVEMSHEEKADLSLTLSCGHELSEDDVDEI